MIKVWGVCKARAVLGSSLPIVLFNAPLNATSSPCLPWLWRSLLGIIWFHPLLGKPACLWLHSALFLYLPLYISPPSELYEGRAGPSLSMPKTLSTIICMQPANRGSCSHWKPTPTIPDVLISISTGNEGWLCFSHCHYFHTKRRFSRFYYKSLRTWVLKPILCASLNGSPSPLQNHRL